MPIKLASQDTKAEFLQSLWTCVPDHLLLSIFRYLTPRAVLDASQVCYRWHRVALDEMLWRDLFYQYFRVSRGIPAAPGALSWRSEFKRLTFRTPFVESEVIQEHRDQVLHVSFAHNGELFATTSKDGFIKVWSAVYPCALKHEADMKEHSWKYTQFSQFNSNDTLLLVSGVHFGSHSTSGEIAVFGLDDDFELRCRVINKPYDIFGAWYNNNYLLSGNLFWRGNFASSSVLYLNKASQALESERESVVTCLYKFLNQNASSIRTILVARCPAIAPEETDQRRSYHSDMSDSNSQSDSENGSLMENSGADDVETCQPLPDKLSVECTESHEAPVSREDCHMLTDGATQLEDDDFCDKYLIFTMGERTYTPHQIGIKRIAASEMKDTIDRLKHRDLPLVPNNDVEPNIDNVVDRFDDIDRSIELHGHIIGMCLSPDHRYLYVNSRTWPKGYQISDPLSPPPIAEEIDIHVIDLVTLTEVGSLLRSHKAYTPNDECFFIFLDVSSQYIASGAEDHHGYLWDRHYGTCLQKFGHSDVVNCVAFNPQDPEVLVTVSDDHSIKIWRSQKRELEVKGSILSQEID